MEYGPKNNIFVLKMMMKSGLEKNILKFLHAQRRSFLLLNLQFYEVKNIFQKILCAWKDFNKTFLVYLHIKNECLSYKFHPYSILKGHTKVESVAY